MLEKFKNWCASDSASARLTRTIFQGIIGVLIANADYIVGGFAIDPATKAVIVALVMAILSPIQATIGGVEKVEGQHVKED